MLDRKLILSMIEDLKGMSGSLARLRYEQGKGPAYVMEQMDKRICELTQCGPCWYDMSEAEMLRLWKKDYEELEAYREKYGELNLVGPEGPMRAVLNQP